MHFVVEFIRMIYITNNFHCNFGWRENAFDATKKSRTLFRMFSGGVDDSLKCLFLLLYEEEIFISRERIHFYCFLPTKIFYASRKLSLLQQDDNFNFTSKNREPLVKL